MFEVKHENLKRYENSVLEYEKQPIEKGKIMFYGSSGFTRWSTKWGNKPLEETILAKDGSKICINHAIGGSCTEELLYYYDRLVRPWAPKALVITCYLNDKAEDYSNAEILFLLFRLLAYARTDMPGIKLFVTDYRPTAKPKSGSYTIMRDEFNNALKDYCARHEDTTLLEFSKFPFLYEEGHVGEIEYIKPDMFIEDNVHYTQETYNLIAEELKKALDDLL